MPLTIRTLGRVAPCRALQFSIKFEKIPRSPNSRCINLGMAFDILRVARDYGHRAG